MIHTLVVSDTNLARIYLTNDVILLGYRSPISVDTNASILSSNNLMLFACILPSPLSFSRGYFDADKTEEDEGDRGCMR